MNIAAEIITLHKHFVSSFRSEYVFNFDNTFELHQDIDVLKKMGLDCGLHSGNCTADDLQQAKAMLPKAFESTLDGKLVQPSKSVSTVMYNMLPYNQLFMRE